jgi:hypothetical protein
MHVCACDELRGKGSCKLLTSGRKPDNLHKQLLKPDNLHQQLFKARQSASTAVNMLQYVVGHMLS